MTGAHDMGGTHGFGPAVPEADEPLFHAPWERKALALTLAMGATGSWNIDASRFAREREAGRGVCRGRSRPACGTGAADAGFHGTRP